jgi:hypothetical protein
VRALLLLLLLAGCSHVSVNASSQSSTGVPPRAGTSFGSSSAGLQVNAGGGAAAAIVVGVILASALREPAQPGSFRSWSDFSDWFWGRPPPEMAGDRKVAEQDCSRPVDLSSGNLKCR